MDFTTLLCPQCGSPLPRQALWRTVSCIYCSAEVTRAADIVHAARFHQAYQRSLSNHAAGGDAIRCGRRQYRPLAHLGMGSSAKLVLADRAGPLPERVVLKIAHAGAAPGHLQREKTVLDKLQHSAAPGAAYFSQRLPQAIELATMADPAGLPREVLVLRNPTGYWGSLDELKKNYPRGLDPRHAVWMWRRILEVLVHVHAGGWAHGNLAPEHLLVHCADHGIMMIGWAGARECGAGAARPVPQARDLMQSAWAIRAMLAHGAAEERPDFPASTPPSLASLLKRASEDPAWCAALGAHGLEQALGKAAHEAFGPPQFVRLTPTPSN